ncbi:hypothetical protein V8C86DRAFT_688638 [Haematococcus lacustris]
MSTNGLIGRSPAIRLSVPVVCCFVQILLVALGGYYVLHNIHAEAAVHPAVIISLPFATIAFLAFTVPLLMFISYSVRGLPGSEPHQPRALPQDCQESLQDPGRQQHESERERHVRGEEEEE